jgi:nitrilase
VATVRAAAVQLSSVLFGREGTVQRIVTKIGELARRGVQFATFPETVVAVPSSATNRADDYLGGTR